MENEEFRKQSRTNYIVLGEAPKIAQKVGSKIEELARASFEDLNGNPFNFSFKPHEMGYLADIVNLAL